jgi:hypothetical protein
MHLAFDPGFLYWSLALAALLAVARGVLGWAIGSS